MTNTIEIQTLPLFPVLNKQLIDFLKSLKEKDWLLPTVARQWNIKDVASHLLDVNLRKISMQRDGWSVPPEVSIKSYSDLVAWLNQLNATWVSATRRLSPKIITDLLEKTNEEVYQIFKNLDPFSSSAYPVSWAGEKESMVWFDIAREYTERWHHQQQMRHAMGDKGIMTQQLYHPLLDTFMRAWPVSMKATADEGTIVKCHITGEGGGDWYLERMNGAWRLVTDPAAAPAAETIIDGQVAWTFFSKSIRVDDIPGRYEIRGRKGLGEAILQMVSVMA